MFNEDITLHTLEEFKRKYGQKQLDSILNVLGHGTILIQVLETEIGQELLQETVARCADLLRRIADDPDCDAKIKIEYKVLREICCRWSARIMKYHKVKNHLKEVDKN